MEPTNRSHPILKTSRLQIRVWKKYTNKFMEKVYTYVFIHISCAQFTSYLWFLYGFEFHKFIYMYLHSYICIYFSSNFHAYCFELHVQMYMYVRRRCWCWFWPSSAIISPSCMHWSKHICTCTYVFIYLCDIFSRIICIYVCVCIQALLMLIFA